MNCTAEAHSTPVILSILAACHASAENLRSAREDSWHILLLRIGRPCDGFEIDPIRMVSAELRRIKQDFPDASN